MSVIRRIIESLRTSGAFTDEEGEDTNALENLAAFTEWTATSDRLPPDETPVLVAFHNGARRIAALFWEEPGYEDTFARYQYWDDPDDDGQNWDWADITHWAPLLEVPPCH
jgi:hypothetical protein